MRKRSAHYVDGKKLTSVLNDYVERRDAARENGTEEPKIPEYVGDCIIRIARNYARSYKWQRIPLRERDDLISSACLVAINAIQNKYDPSKMASGSAFSFLTTTVYYGFLGVVNKAQKQMNLQTRYTGAFMDGQTDIGVDPSHQQFYNASLVDIRKLADNYKSDEESDKDLNYAKQYSDRLRKEKKESEIMKKREAEEKRAAEAIKDEGNPS